MIDYPGFGKTTGKPTEKLIDEEALLMYDMASKEIKNDSIVIYGKSIGTGVAAYVASNSKMQPADFRNSILQHSIHGQILFSNVPCTLDDQSIHFLSTTT